MGSLNRMFAILCSKIQQLLPPLALGIHYNCIKYSSPLHCPKPGRAVQWTMGNKKTGLHMSLGLLVAEVEESKIIF